MNYEEALNFISSLEAFGIKPGLERMRMLMSLADYDCGATQFVHIAGTNGKGSVSSALACTLISAGYKTGLFTSPYVTDFRERMKINGEMIPQEAFAEIMTRLKPFIEAMAAQGNQITEFEAITAAGLIYFSREQCDYVVLEVGLGGRLDATNIIGTPLLSVITSISLDHTKILGDTVSKIAAEKCGIIKQNGHTVTCANQDADALKVITLASQKRGNTLSLPDIKELIIKNSDLFGTDIIYKGIAIHIPVGGMHQVENAALSAEAALQLRSAGVKITDKDIIKGIGSSALPARTEILSREPLIILDGGHNASGVAALSALLRNHLKNTPHGKVFAVCGMMADKDYARSVSFIASLCDEFAAVKPQNPRSLDAQTLADCAGLYCRTVRTAESPQNAVRDFLKKSQKNDIILVCGSLYLAGEIRGFIVESAVKST
ncbi:MAG: bifunctional folylpolyglutamate synthase/dihydrofolate synthase [Clostridiales bacterium]|nr:bifunctional folylpolyglutamate synthase/dihydrofolate synthase [Clostridiales bacterium]